MKNHWKLWCILLITGIIAEAGAQTITAVSDPFTFPPITAVKGTRPVIHHAAYFTYSNTVSRNAGIQFTWSFPTQPQYQKGEIVIYSPLGRVLKRFSISTSQGTVSWGTGKEPGMGVYIAKITCGVNSRGLKFLICR